MHRPYNSKIIEDHSYTPLIGFLFLHEQLVIQYFLLVNLDDFKIFYVFTEFKMFTVKVKSEY